MTFGLYVSCWLLFTLWGQIGVKLKSKLFMKDYELKARALVLSYFQLVGDTETAKMGALIAVSEILDAHFMKKDSGYKTYWLNVKKAIEAI